ncbi:MAG: discoidin domain-containing protein [Verrucomicrobiales bacterium]
MPLDLGTKHFEFRFETSAKQSPDSYRFSNARASSASPDSPAKKAIDGVVSDASRWISARDQNGPSWLELTLEEPKNIGWLSVASGFQNRSPVEQWVLQYKNNGEWRDIPSTRVKDNASNLVEIAIPQNERVTSDSLRLLFPHEAGELIRIREVLIKGPTTSDRGAARPTYRLER